MNKEGGLVKSIFSYSISSWINIILGFLYTIISTRVLKPETYGVVSMFMSSSNTLMYIVCMGLDASFIRFFNEPPNNEHKNIFSFKLIFLVSINLLIVLLISTVFLFDWFNHYMFGRLSWFLTIMLYCSVYSNLILRFLNINYRMSFNIRQYTIQNILIQNSMKMLTLAAALIVPAYEVIIAFQVIGIFLITIVYVIIQRNDILPLKRDTAVIYRTMYKDYFPIIKFAVFSAPLYISTNLNTLLTQQIIRDTLGNTKLGIYSAVNVFATLYSAVQTGFSTFWSAYVYKNYSEEHHKISAMTDYVMLVGIISLGNFVLFRQILYLFIGKEYKSSISFFSMILMINVFNLLAQSTIYGIDIVEKNYITAITNCIYVIINAGFVSIVNKYWGLIGVAYVVMFARLLLFGINTIIAQRFYKTILNIKRFLLGMIVILTLAILPSFKLDNVFTNITTIILISSTFLIYKEQYKYGVVIIKNKIGKRIKT